MRSCLTQVTGSGIVPSVSTTSTSTPEAERLIAEAHKAHEAYPQYVGHYDGWQVAEAKADVRWRRSKTFVALKGDRLIFDPASVHVSDGSSPLVGTDGKTRATFYSPRLGWDIVLPVGRFKGTFPVPSTTTEEQA